MKKANILVISPAEFPGTGGDFSNFLEILLGLKELGMNTALLCPAHDLQKAFDKTMKEKDIRVIRIKVKSPRLTEIGKKNVIRLFFELIIFYILELWKYIFAYYKVKPHIIFVRHSIQTFLLAPLLSFGKTKSIADGEILYIDLKSTLGLPDFLYKLFYLLERKLIFKYTAFKVTTNKQRKLFEKFGFPKTRIVQVPIAININKIPKYPIDTIPKWTFGYFGTLEKWQNVDFLIKAFQKVVQEIPQSKLYIIGKGSQLEYLRSLTKQLHLEKNIIFTGSVPREQLHEKYFQYFQITVLPRGKLSVPVIPIKLIESLAAGKPVIASKNEETEKYEEKGLFLFRENNLDDLASKMIYLAKNKNKLHEQAKFAITTAKNFDVRIVLQKILAFIENIDA